MGHFEKGAWVEDECITGIEDCILLLKKIQVSMIITDAMRQAAKEMDKSSKKVLEEVSEVYYQTGMMPAKPYIRPHGEPLSNP